MANNQHGHSPNGKPSPTYISWMSMRQRCRDPKHRGFAHYGGRGVTVQWSRFADFLADMGPRPSKAHCLSRKDHDLPYQPGNVVWGLRAENLAEMLARRAAFKSSNQNSRI